MSAKIILGGMQTLQFILLGISTILTCSVYWMTYSVLASWIDDELHHLLQTRKDATQIVANLQRQQVNSRLIASEYLEKNKDLIDILISG